MRKLSNCYESWQELFQNFRRIQITQKRSLQSPIERLSQLKTTDFHQQQLSISDPNLHSSQLRIPLPLRNNHQTSSLHKRQSSQLKSNRHDSKHQIWMKRWINWVNSQKSTDHQMSRKQLSIILTIVNQVQPLFKNDSLMWNLSQHYIRLKTLKYSQLRISSQRNMNLMSSQLLKHETLTLD